ncbi:DUF4143 domain-containing protein, partial [Candidatus Peregrinibacteria bacterium]|nr:DUF4143 domain-containing protein [Candidatus Peregrinibacteria bacterium]
EIFPAIKRRVDASDARGRYWLTGSQQFSVLQGLRESLAGRVGILHLLGFSLAEILRKPVSKGPFPFPKTGTGLMPLSERSLFEHIWRGSFPALWVSHSPDWSAFYSAYVQTYLERDVSLIAGVTKLGAFQDFIALCAARTGQLLHVSELARDAGISVHAARAWLSILEQSLIVFRLRPYHANLTKRMVKMSKLYMLDTGLASFLCRWQTPGTLMAGAMSGPLFETFVVGEIIKSYFLRGLPPPITFFRDKEGHEVDLLIEADGALHPFEIKRAVQVRPDALAQIAFLRSRIPRIGRGGVISLVPEVVPLSREDDVIPVGAIS